MYKIEKGVPIPKRRTPGPIKFNVPCYPWDEMEIGDSFFVPITEDRTILSIQSSVQALIVRARKNKPYLRYVTRRCEEGLRIWRIS